MHDIPILVASVYTFPYLKDNFTSASVYVVFSPGKTNSSRLEKQFH